MMFEVFVYIQGVEEFGVKTRKQHIHHNGDVDLLCVGQVLVGVLLILDAFLYVLIVQVKFIDAVIGAVGGIIIGNDRLKGSLFLFGGFGVIQLFLGQVFLNLLHILVAFSGRRKHAGNAQRLIVAVCRHAFCLNLFEKLVILYGVSDAGRSKQRIEFALGGGGIVFVQYGFHDSTFEKRLTGLGDAFALRLVIFNEEAQHVAIFNGMGNGVGVQLTLKNICGGLVRSLFAFKLRVGGVCFKYRGAGEAKKLGIGEKVFDGFVVITKLGAVALVKNKHHALIPQGFQALFVVAGVVGIEGKAQFLNGGDDNLVGVIVGKQALHQRSRVGVGLNTAFLKAVELFTRLAVKVFAVNHKQTLFYVRVVFEQGGCLKGRQRLAAACGVPDVAVPTVLVNTVHNGLDGIYLVGPHDHQLLLAGHKHHIAADHLCQRTFCQEVVCKAVKLGDFFVVVSSELVQRQKTFIRIKTEMAAVIVGKVPRIAHVADNEKLQKTEQRFAVAIAVVVFILHDLLHGPARADGQRFQLNLHHRDAIDKQYDVITVVAIVCIYAELVNNLKGVLAPIFDIDQCVKERRTVVALKAVAFAQKPRGVEHVRGNNLFQQAGKFTVRQAYSIQGFKLLSEVGLQRGTVADVLTVDIFKASQVFYQLLFDLLFCHELLDPPEPIFVETILVRPQTLMATSCRRGFCLNAGLQCPKCYTKKPHRTMSPVRPECVGFAKSQASHAPRSASPSTFFYQPGSEPPWLLRLTALSDTLLHRVYQLGRFYAQSFSQFAHHFQAGEFVAAFQPADIGGSNPQTGCQFILRQAAGNSELPEDRPEAGSSNFLHHQQNIACCLFPLSILKDRKCPLGQRCFL